MFRFCVLLIAAAITLSATASAGSYYYGRYQHSYSAPQHAYGGHGHVGGYSGYGSYGGYGGYGYGYPIGPPVQQYLVPVTYRVPIFIAPRPCASDCGPVTPAPPLR